MEDGLHCDFFFGNTISSKIKKMDYNHFKRRPNELKFILLFHHFYWMKGAISLVFKPYRNYIITGEPFCLSTWVILILNRLFGKRTYLWSHGWYGNESYVKVLLKKIFFKLSHGIFLYGHYAEELMIKEGIEKDKLKVIYNSLHYSKQKLLREDLITTNIYYKHFGNLKPTVIFIGRVGYKKKIDQILQALYIAKSERMTQFNVCIIGKGNDFERIRKIIEELELSEDVWLFGPCYNEEKISELIYNADVCVSPGEVGLTAIHSLSYGTPVITHNDFVSQMPEFEVIKEGETGSFFTKNNVKSLLNVLENWFKKYPQKTRALSENCYRLIDLRYNPDFQLKIIKDTIENSAN